MHKLKRFGTARCFALGAAMVSASWCPNAEGQLGPLFGGPTTIPERRAAPLDPSLPTGPAYASPRSRPRDGQPRACSFRRPVCVHAGKTREAAGADGVLRWLRSLESAYDVIAALRAP